MKSIERLRRYTEVNWDPWPESRKHINDMLDEIEQEVSESHMELPKDADGIPIHIGDTLVKLFGDKETDIEVIVEGVGIDSVFVNYDEDDMGRYGLARYECPSKMFRHKQPDSWERIIEDVRRRTSDYYCNQIPCNFDKMAEEMVARCKVLAKEEQ